MLFYNEYVNRVFPISHVASFKHGRSTFVKGYLAGESRPVITWPSMVSETLDSLVLAALKNLQYRFEVNKSSVARQFLVNDWHSFVRDLKDKFICYVDNMEQPYLLILKEEYNRYGS